jgi:hypothetical protein
MAEGRKTPCSASNQQVVGGFEQRPLDLIAGEADAKKPCSHGPSPDLKTVEIVESTKILCSVVGAKNGETATFP